MPPRSLANSTVWNVVCKNGCTDPRSSVKRVGKFPLFFPLFPLLFPLLNPGSFRHLIMARRQIVQPSKGLDDSLP